MRDRHSNVYAGTNEGRLRCTLATGDMAILKGDPPDTHDDDARKRHAQRQVEGEETRPPPPAYTETPSDVPPSSSAPVAVPNNANPATPLLSGSVLGPTLTPAGAPVMVMGTGLENQHPHHHHQNYGPTPIGQYYPRPPHNGVGGAVIVAGTGATGTVRYLPYYDPNSPYAVEEASRRGRRRFVGAVIWAVAIWCAVGMISGGVAFGASR
ncbi:uncharacterized protein EI90DRAFT_3034156 [Cantharellus anzutake]|uniref:uncharacterized protein n=1 Tax=Cantharellus anzutake TaxID=1750568 RepID=UPI0019063974|nr:uncharacterized protein EI90DRAFT_3034156 [Cantharellus anzutake]KAF8341506.1 hypothetical protein EI90DRAFT_3034156 [Cantharellus anzutake]